MAPCWYSDTWITHPSTDHRAEPSVVAEDIKIPYFESLIHKFLQHQLNLPPSLAAKPLDLEGNISIYMSAVAIYCAPSDICGICGMARECIHTTSQWGKFHIPHYDPTFVVTDPNVLGMGRLDIARVKLIFAFTYDGKTYPCALVHCGLSILEASESHLKWA